MVVGTTALCFKDWRQRLWVDVWSWAGAGGMVVVLIVPWFAYEYATFGPRFWDVMFGAHVYDRMRGTLAPSHVQPWSYYYAGLYGQLTTVGARTWVVVGAALWMLESARRRWKGGVLVLAWYLIPLSIISMSLAKLYHYSLPFLPPIALMGAYPASLLARLARRLYTASTWTEWIAHSSWLRPVRYAVSALPVVFLLLAWPVEQYGAMLGTFGNGRPLRTWWRASTCTFRRERGSSTPSTTTIVCSICGNISSRHPMRTCSCGSLYPATEP